MAVTKTDWAKPASEPVNSGGLNRGQSAAAQRYAASAAQYRPSTASGGVFGSPVRSVGGSDDGSDAAAAVQAMIDQQIAAKQAQEAQQAAAAAAAVQASINAQVAQRQQQQQQAAQAAAAVQASINAQIAQRQQQQQQQQAMLVGTSDMGFTDQMLASGVSPGLLQARYGENAPAVMEYLDRTILGGPVQGVLGALGMKTAQQHLATGTGQPVFDENGVLRGTLSTGPFGVVYSGTRIPGYEGEYAELIRPDENEGSEEDQPEVTSTVQDPMTGQEECPDGYIFDEDLQACRLAPMERAAVDTTPGERYIRSGLLDVAPEGLMGFQERYGAGFGSPMDFAAANREFRMGGAVTPSFYSAPPKLDGYTLLT